MSQLSSNQLANKHYDCHHSIRNEVNLWHSQRIISTIRRFIDLDRDSDDSDDSDDSSDTIQVESSQFSALEFGSGAGLISQLLCPSFDSILGLDISIARVEEYNLSVEQQGLDPTDMRAIQRDYLLDEDAELDGQLFDLVVCANTYHHILDLAQLTSALGRRLKPGAVLIVVDLNSEIGFGAELKKRANQKGTQADTGLVAHRGGFSQAELRKLFEESGRFDEVLVEVSHSTTLKELRAIRGENWSKESKSDGNMKVMEESKSDEVSWNVAVGRRAAST